MCFVTFSYVFVSASGEAILGTQRYFINLLYQSTLSKHFIKALYQSTLSTHFIKALYQSTLSKHFIKSLYASMLSKHFIKLLVQGTSNSRLEVPVKALQMH